VFITIGIEKLPEMSSFLLRPDSPTDRVSLLKKGVHHPNGDIAIRTGDQDLAGGLHNRHDVSEVFWGREIDEFALANSNAIYIYI